MWRLSATARWGIIRSVQPATLFRVAAIAWLGTAVARVLLLAVGAGPPPAEGGSTTAFLVGAVFGVALAWLHWTRPEPRTAAIGGAFGLYTMLAILYLPLVGVPLWFVVTLVTGAIAMALSGLCFLATRRPDPGG